VDAVRRRPLPAFWLLAIAFSWVYWVPLALWAPQVSHVPGLLGPLLAGVVVTAATGGPTALKGLLGRTGRWRLPVRLWLTVPGLLGVAYLTVVVLAPLGRGWPGWAAMSSMAGLPELGWLPVSLLLLLVNGFGEEVGWRGCAWPRLRRRHGLAAAAGLLAVPWALWHLPTFWLDTGLRGFPPLMVPGWLLGLAAGAVVLGRLYEAGRASLLLVAAFHAALNMGSATAGTEGAPAVAVSATVIAAAVWLLRSPSASRPWGTG
jgi:uncharacterized protein